MQTVYFLRGLPASGKSTFAKKLMKENHHVRRVNKDLIRLMLFGDNKWSKSKEELVKNVEFESAIAILDAGYDLIVDNTHFNNAHELKYRELSDDYNALFQLVDFSNVSIEDCLRRDHLREDKTNYQVILGMAQKYVPQLYQEFITKYHDIDKFVESLQQMKYSGSINYELKPCIWVDIDGTLALTCNRNVYDDVKCVNDIPNYPIVNLAKIFNNLGGYKIFIFSGRSETARDATELWLAKYDIPYDVLVMRKTGDNREDSIVKREMYEEYIANQYNCEYVIDDRDSVVGMARKELNLTVLQCNFGNF